jgi:hypothetical protein
MALGVRCQTKSSHFAIIVPQDATESLAARHLTDCTSDFLTRADQSRNRGIELHSCLTNAIALLHATPGVHSYASSWERSTELAPLRG